MNTVLVLLCVVAQFSVAFTVKDTQTCLTWNVTDEHLFLKCKVFGLKHKMQMIDASKHIRAECTNILSLNCATNRDDDFAFTNSSENGFSLVLKTTKTNGEGNWTCLHGTNEANVNIRISEGTVYSADVQLSGEVMEMKDHFRFTLTCFSCWVPYMKNVYFIVNDVLEDNIRYSDGKCYHKRKECSPTECTCSTEGNNFTWVFISDLSYLEFSCEMKFIDEYHLSIQTASVIYKETEFQQDIKKINIIEVSDKADCVKKETTTIETAWIACFFSVMIIYFSVVFLRNYLKEDTWITESHNVEFDKVEEYPLIADSGNVKYDSGTTPFTIRLCCYTCYTISVSSICIDCRQKYCVICSNEHTKYYKDHHVCQIHHDVKSQREITCDSCSIKNAEQLCAECCHTMCESCAKTHIHRKSDKMKMMIIYQGSTDLNRQKPAQNIKYLYSILLKKEETDDRVQVCGMSYIGDGRIVLVDRKNRQLIVFKMRKEQLKLKLDEEPCGMTAMTENLFAITFEYQMLIQIFEIREENIIVKENIDLPKIGLGNIKPFSIAFDKDVFVVEVGVGDDGEIIILDNKKKHASICNERLLFTGNTIRLALQVNNQNPLAGHVFVSEMCRQAVYCFNFEGNLLWRVSVRSPRGIIVVPEDLYPGKNLVLCSRHDSVIYWLSKYSGSDEVLLAKGKIKCPRFVSYNSNDRLLCIQVGKGEDEDELQVFEICLPSLAEANSSDHLLGT